MTKTKSLAMTDLRPAFWMGLLLASALLVSGCSNVRADKVSFDGIFFRSTADAIDKQRDVFEVKVSPVSSSLEGAREAGRYEATSYCIENFGTSDLLWSQGPDAEDGTLIIDNNSLILRGICKPQ